MYICVPPYLPCGPAKVHFDLNIHIYIYSGPSTSSSGAAVALAKSSSPGLVWSDQGQNLQPSPALVWSDQGGVTDKHGVHVIRALVPACTDLG
jgi:hypothetical protein